MDCLDIGLDETPDFIPAPGNLSARRSQNA
jgi:hypothetical protein